MNHTLTQKILTNWKRKTDRLAEREKQQYYVMRFKVEWPNKSQGWQSHRIDDILRYLLRRKTAMRFCDAMQSRITYTIFFAII